MASTYTTNLGIEKPATGEQSGTWGATTNTNFDILDQAIGGIEAVTLSTAGSSGSPTALPITDGAVSTGRNKYIEFVDGGDLGATAYVQLTPNDSEKVVYFRNSLSGSRSILIFQGTYSSSRDIEIPNGKDVVLKFDGGGSTAIVTYLQANEYYVGNTQLVGNLDVDNININGNTISSTDTNGNLTIDPNGTGNIVLDANVGIGTASPSEQLHVIGDIIASGYLRVASTQEGGIFDTDGNNGLTVTGSTGSPASTIRAYTGGSERLRIDSSGNVGIGTTSPSYLTEIAGNGGGDTVTLALTNASSNPARVRLNSGHGNWSVGNSISVADALEFRDESAGSTRMFIDNSGNVGIGSSVTALFNGVGGSMKLVVTGDDSTTTIANNSDAGIAIVNTNQTAGNLAGLHFARADTDDNPNYAGASIVAQFPEAQVTGQYPKGELAFLTSTATNSAPSEKMRIDSSGNVGIGTTSPSSYGKFVVRGSGNIMNLDATSGPVYAAFKENTTNRFFLATLNGSDGLAFIDADGSTERMRIDSDGDVNTFYNLRVGGTTDASADGAIQTGLVNFRNSFTPSGERFQLDCEGLAAAQTLVAYYYDGVGYRNRMSIAGNSSGETIFNESSQDIDFRVESNSNANMLVVDAGNDSVYIGKNTPAVSTNGILLGTSSATVSASTGNTWHTYNTATSTYTFYVSATGTVNYTSLNSLSDQREKTNIVDLPVGLDAVKQLRPRQFDWINEDQENNVYGFIAQEVEEVLPNIVTDYMKDESVYRKGLKHIELVAVLTKAIQEQQTLIETLEARITALEAN